MVGYNHVDGPIIPIDRHGFEFLVMVECLSPDPAIVRTYCKRSRYFSIVIYSIESKINFIYWYRRLIDISLNKDVKVTDIKLYSVPLYILHEQALTL